MYNENCFLGLLEVNAGGMPPGPPLFCESKAIPSFFVFFKNSFFANEQENIFGGLTVKV